MRTTVLTFVLVAASQVLAMASAASNPVSSPAIDNLKITDWQRGRMTFYGKDGYSIHSGACHFGSIPHPYYVAATSDWWPEYINGAYEHNKCGHCFEIQCDPNGRSYCRGDRYNASIIVQVTDRCPCKHENPSNQRWCCGDEPHFDVSHEAFGELANHVGGWVYLQWREIQCPDGVGRGGALLEDPYNWTPYCTEGEESLGEMAKRRGLTTFLEAVWRAGPEVWDRLGSRARASTVVAPTNEAFANYADSLGLTVQELLEQPTLASIMRHHFFKEEISDREGALDTVSDFPITVRMADDGKMALDGVRVVEELSSCNGDLLVCDKVLWGLCKGAEAKGVAETAFEGGMKLFAQALWKLKAEMEEKEGVKTLGEEAGLWTVLAPTDGAWETFLAERGENMTEFLDSEDFVPVVSNHIIAGETRVGYMQPRCHDLLIPADVLADNVTQCEDLPMICGDPWLSRGYCAKTCGVCSEKGGETLVAMGGKKLVMESTNVDAEDQLEIFQNSEELTAPQDDATKVRIEDSLVLVPDIPACNGFLNILDKVIV
mmetsp:Transcript_3893/g.13677  ORF Transcript_3893/g.13677 Transcript_3893/m.13677 type:complete len:546 (+) Transcript_3893:1005-2642(+)|eukprot:CAMPEP_0197510314 /NCGR_PEP_ID=MMETSP1312-20131121/50460_1 /TAXON_ID=464262 /ORGANISM="Genus nov. species nov., Strain RCC2335" /LENGTH=545 /DNA_ID=CAMNT_0043058253 /DNA_START=225 /DNA_END=1862 /DNA_ORIENTATION=+